MVISGKTLASIIKEVLKGKEFEHLCFDGIIRFPQKGEIELLLSCDMRLAIGKMKSTEEIKKEVKEIEQMKEAFGRGDGKASIEALLSLLEMHNTTVEIPSNSSEYFTIFFNQYCLEIKEKEVVMSVIEKAEEELKYSIGLTDKELNIIASTEHHNPIIASYQNHSKLSLSIPVEENPSELVRGSLEIFVKGKLTVSYHYYIPFLLIKEYLEATIGTANPREIISLVEKNNHFVKNMEKLFEQCKNFLAILKIDELLKNLDLNKKKGKFRVLINNQVAELYKEGRFARTIEQKNFHINFGYNNKDKCFYAQIEKPNVNRQGQTKKLTWTINEKGEVKTEVNMEKKFITKEMEAFEGALKEESEVIIPTLVNLEKSKEMHSHKKVFARPT